MTRRSARQHSAKPAFKSWDSYNVFARAVRKEQRFAQNAAAREFLDAVRKTSNQRARRLRTGESLARAQLGFAWEPIQITDDEYDAIPGPHPEQRMVPDPSLVGDGRGNPHGIAYMYLSEVLATAIAEVRPWKGAYVTIAVFEILRDLKLVDCTLGHTGLEFHMKPPKPDQWDKLVWKDIDRAFATPVDPDDVGAYVPTQILAEVFKDEGYDGVAYRSALGKKRNFLIFDVSATHLIMRQLRKVTEVKYRAREAGNAYGNSRKTVAPPGPKPKES